MNQIIQNFVTEFIKINNAMELGTVEDDIAYTCQARYISLDGRHLYFVTRTATRHCQIITNYSQVRAVIAERGGPFSARSGVEFLGEVEKVCDEAELKVVATGYMAAFPASAKMIAALLPGMAYPGAPVAFYRVTVEQVKAINPGAELEPPEYLAA